MSLVDPLHRHHVVVVDWTAVGPRVQLSQLRPDEIPVLLAALAHVCAAAIGQRGQQLPTAALQRVGLQADAVALLEAAIATLRANPHADAIAAAGHRAKGG